MRTVAVIGGGAAGLIAAGAAGEAGAAVTLFERNEKTGKKLYITGKGRCNVTNDCPPAEFLKNVVTNPKFLFGAVHSFTPADAVDLLARFGLKTKVERGNRVFPASDHASDVIKALTRYAEQGGTVRLNARVEKIERTDGRFAVTASGERHVFDAVIVATGGVSYPSTGSDGDGYGFAAAFGHTVVPPRPALVGIRLRENVSALAGLSLKNVRATVAADREYAEFGEMLFTQDGVSGPVVLTLSSRITRQTYRGRTFSIDLKPALDCATLDARLLADFQKYANKQFKNALDDLLPKSLIPYVVGYVGIAPDKPVHSVTAEERKRLVTALKALTFTIDDLEPVERAVVTSGGVDVKAVNPKTLESKLVPGLYFAGEVLDVDALTGGFNIQIALSTGYAAGQSAGRG